MWLDLAEMQLILGALEHILDRPPGPIDEPGYSKLRDYFREQVARVERVAAEWERRKAEDIDDAPIHLTDEQVRRLGGKP